MAEIEFRSPGNVLEVDLDSSKTVVVSRKPEGMPVPKANEVSKLEEIVFKMTKPRRESESLFRPIPSEYFPYALENLCKPENSFHQNGLKVLDVTTKTISPRYDSNLKYSVRQVLCRDGNEYRFVLIPTTEASEEFLAGAYDSLSGTEWDLDLPVRNRQPLTIDDKLRSTKAYFSSENPFLLGDRYIAQKKMQGGMSVLIFAYDTNKSRSEVLKFAKKIENFDWEGALHQEAETWLKLSGQDNLLQILTPGIQEFPDPDGLMKYINDNGGIENDESGEKIQADEKSIDATKYFSTEHCRSLMDYFDLYHKLADREGNLRHEESFFRLVEGCTNALKIIHECDITHRDIKLGNIFFVEKPIFAANGKLIAYDLEIIVGDAGIAIDYNSQRLIGGYDGTPSLAEPESFLTYLYGLRFLANMGKWIDCEQGVDVYNMGGIGKDFLSTMHGLKGPEIDFYQLVESIIKDGNMTALHKFTQARIDKINQLKQAVMEQGIFSQEVVDLVEALQAPRTSRPELDQLKFSSSNTGPNYHINPIDNNIEQKRKGDKSLGPLITRTEDYINEAIAFLEHINRVNETGQLYGRISHDGNKPVAEYLMSRRLSKQLLLKDYLQFNYLLSGETCDPKNMLFIEPASLMAGLGALALTADASKEVQRYFCGPKGNHLRAELEHFSNQHSAAWAILYDLAVRTEVSDELDAVAINSFEKFNHYFKLLKKGEIYSQEVKDENGIVIGFKVMHNEEEYPEFVSEFLESKEKAFKRVYDQVKKNEILEAVLANNPAAKNYRTSLLAADLGSVIKHRTDPQRRDLKMVIESHKGE